MNGAEIHRQLVAHARAVRWADLHGANLAGLDLRQAILPGADLRGKTLSLRGSAGTA